MDHTSREGYLWNQLAIAVLIGALITLSGCDNYNLIKNPGLSALILDFNTVKGEVTLKGEVNNDAARQRAGSIASATSGVAKVNNLITIKG